MSDIDSNFLDFNDLIMYIPTITPYHLLKCEFPSLDNFLHCCSSSHFEHKCDIFMTTVEEKMSRVLHTSVMIKKLDIT